VQLQLELACEQITWFPGRLRHILDNLVGNALKNCDRSKGEMRIQVGCSRLEGGYELRVSDNGLGLTRAAQSTLLELFDRARPAHLADPVVELAVVKIIIEQTGGSLTVESMRGQGTSFVAVLPYFEMADYLA
jgi:signal transduction histidine kinase